MLSSLKQGYHALVVGGSGGIGSAIAARLKSDPQCAGVVALSRSSAPRIDFGNPSTLENAARELSARGTTYQCLIIATGALTTSGGAGPEKAFDQLTHETMTELFNVNTIGPALALKAFLPLISRRERCLVVTLSARVGSIGDNGLGGWISYRASKAALNQITRTAAIELKRRNDQSVCVALHPGTIPTRLSEPYARGRFTHSPDDCAHNLLSVLDLLSADQTGGFYDYAGKEIVW